MKTNKEILSLRYKSTSKFFSTSEGDLTASHANFIANMAKEMAKDLKAPYTHVHSLNKQIELDSKVISITDYKLPNVSDVTKIGELYALTGWLREAIKAKDRVLEDIDDNNNYDVLTSPKYDHMLDGIKEVQRPLLITYVANDDREVFNISEHADYLLEEAIAAHIGQLIHENTHIDRERKLSLSGHEDLIQEMKNGSISVAKFNTVEGFNEMYYKLQSIYRDAEKKNNYNKAKMRNLNSTAEQNFLVEAKEKYEADNVIYNKYLSEVESSRSKYEQERNKFKSDSRKLTLELKGVFSSFKIAIPDALKTIYTEVSDKVGQ